MPFAVHRRDPELLRLAPDEKMPNSSLPVVIYRQVAEGTDLRNGLSEAFARHGWGGVWANGIFGYHHFHSNAHEVLGVAGGDAIVVLGGQSGQQLEIAAGDVLILPAGTGHRRIRASADFLVIGAYPKGQENYDTYTDLAACGNYRARLAAVPLPERDPVYGKDGAVPGAWR